MKTMAIGRKLIVLGSAVLLALGAFGAWSAKADECSPNALRDLTVSKAIDIRAGKAYVTVTNKPTSKCAYPVGFASYKITVPWNGSNEQAYLEGQRLYDVQVRRHPDRLTPGESYEFVVDVPDCQYQLDVYAFKQGMPDAPAVPDFGTLAGQGLYWLLDSKGVFSCDTPPSGALSVTCSAGAPEAYPGQPVVWTATASGGNGPSSYTFSWTGNGSFPSNATGQSVTAYYHATGTKNANVTVTSGGKTTSYQCHMQIVEPAPGTCVPNPKGDLKVGTIRRVSATKLEVDVTNTSTKCEYNFGFSSYKTGDYIPGQEQSFIDAQKLFDFDLRYGTNKLRPGEKYTFKVNAPTCNWQADAYWFKDGADPKPVPPDFAKLQEAGTHWLFDADFNGAPGSCFTVVEQCPVPNLSVGTAPNGKVGQAYSHTFSVTGGRAPVSISVEGALPPGLTRSGNTISGTPTQAGSWTFAIIAKSAGGDPNCQQAKNITITVTEDQVQCVPPTITSTALPPSVKAGEAFSYTITTNGGTGPVVISTSQLPAGLSRNGNVISGTPTQAGSFTVMVTAKGNGGNTPGCQYQKAVTIVVTNDSVCVPPTISGAGTKVGRVGQSFSHTFSVSGGTSPLNWSVSGDLPPGLSRNGTTISGTPTQAGTWTLLIDASAGSGAAICKAQIPLEIRIDTVTTGCTGHCGGIDQPNVQLSSVRRPPEAPLAFVYLSSVPYTGLSFGAKTILFTIGLLVWSAFVTALIFSRRFRGKLLSIIRRGRRTHASAASFETSNTPAGFYEAARTFESSRMQPARTHAAAPVTVSAPSAASVAASSASAGDMLGASLSRQVEVLKRQPTLVATTGEEATAAMKLNAESGNGAIEAMLETAAKEKKVLISDYGLKLVALAANNSEDQALKVLDQLISVARTWYPAEDGWLVLNKEKIQKVLFSTYITMVPIFIQWLVESNSKKVFSFLRMLRTQEHSVKEFIKNVVYELDNVYRYRIEGGAEFAEPDQHSLQVTVRWSTEELERKIGILISAVDEAYKTSYMPIKLALLKVMEAPKKKKAAALPETAKTELPSGFKAREREYAYVQRQTEQTAGGF
jgi:hypothetical protein